MWGATGFTGRLVAEHLVDSYDPDDLALAIAGRNEAKLENLRAELTDRSDAWEKLPILTGDAHDRESMGELARRTRVVCTTVGPYAEYGTPLVAACVEEETDYCDLSGEIHWIRELIDRYHEEAAERGVRIVHSCGFDSVPTDLGVLLAQKHAVEEYGTPCEQVRCYLEGGRGGVSGGTLESIAGVFEAARGDSTARRVLANPYSLAPPGEREGPDPGEQRRPRMDPDSGEWTAPSPMATINERVLRRSNALLDYPWGRDFRCTEVISTGSGPLGALKAAGMTTGLGLFVVGMSLGPIRSGLRRWVFPASGEGPSRKRIESGSFAFRFVGTGTDEDGSTFRVESRVAADLDPGYGATAWMLGEAATCLVEEDVETPLSGGVLTPASGIGRPLIDRLRDAGMTFRVG